MSAEREIRQLQKAKEKAQRGGDAGAQAAACNQLGEALASHGRYEEALAEHREELRLLEAAGDRLGRAVAHRKIGERLAELERYEAALQHQRQHLELAQALGDHTEQQRAWATIGRTHMMVAESRAGADGEEGAAALREAEGAFRTSLAILEERLEGSVGRRELTEMRTRLYLNLGLVYDSLKDAAKCSHYMNKSIFLAEQAQLPEDLQRAYFNLGHMQLRAGAAAPALRCLARARDCARRMQDRALESECCSSAAQVLLSLGDFAAARRALRQAHALGSRQPWQRRLVRGSLRYAAKASRLQEALEAAGGDAAAALALCEQLGDLCSKQGDYGCAARYYERQLGYAEALQRPPHELAVIHVSLATTFGDLREHARAVRHYSAGLALHGGNALEEGRTWLNMALAKEEAGEPGAELERCLRAALERAEAAGEPRLQRQVLRRLHALQQRDGSAEAPATMARLQGLAGGSAGEEEDEEEEEELESSEALDESELELSESDEEEEDELEGYSKSVPGRRRASKWTRRNERGETPLHRACIEGDLRRAQLLLKQGHPVNPRDYCGWTPLHEACNHGHLEIVRLLLEAGAALDDAGGPGCEGITPLHDALSCGHFDVAELLLRRGASVAARTAKGLTPRGTLAEWVSLYGEELDEETRRRCRDTERLLQEAEAAARGAPGPSQLFDAELSEPPEAPPCPSPEPPGARRDEAEATAAAAPKRPREPPAPGGCRAELEAALRGLGSARRPPGAAAEPPRAPAPRAALIPAHEYVGDDWLEDDVGPARGARKRLRREPTGGALGNAGNTGSGGEGTRDGDPRGTRAPAGPHAHSCPRPRQAPAPPPPAPATLRVRVRVQDSVFLVPVPQSERRAVCWLAEQAARRHYEACGLLPRLTLSKEGALLAPHDLVADVLRSNEEVLAEVQSWELPPLAERYRKACESLDVEPHALLLKVTELQGQSAALSVPALALRPPQLPPLLRALKLQAPLRQLRLRGAGLGDGAAAELGAALHTVPGLELLDLSGNRLSARGLQELLPARPGAAAFQSLQELDLSLNPLGAGAWGPLAPLLRACPALSALRLRACGLRAPPHGGPDEALAGAARLEALALSCNALGPAAAVARLLRSLPCRALARLELGAVVRAGGRALAEAVGAYLSQDGCALGELTLSGNGLDDAAVRELARCLPGCPSLLSLDLSANPGVGAAGLRALLAALEPPRPGLQHLNLAGCAVEGLDAATWAGAAAVVRDLRLCSRRVTARERREAAEGWRPPPGAAARALLRRRKLFCSSL
ncbi:tonsoku-like protein [Eudromia elegans]